MSQPVEPAALQPATVLPRAHILSYVATISSPTRVRALAGRILLLLGAIHVLMALAMGAFAVWQFLEDYPLGPRPSPLTLDVAEDFLREELPAIFLCFYAVNCAALFFLCARPVARGRRWACHLALVPQIPLIAGLCPIGAFAGAMSAVLGFGIGGGGWSPSYFSLFLVTVIVVPVMGSLFDVMGFLLWVARNPITEKPPVAFLPARGK